jgi:hypothetical protein
MKVATIVPQNYLHLLKKDDYLMCLGNLINKPGMERYTEFYRQKCADGAFVIMDNGLIENDPRPLPELIEKAYQLGASEMVMTDVFRDKEATLKAIEEGMKQIGDDCPIRLMFVPQGNTIDEWVMCAAYLIRHYIMYKITIGVPKVLVDIGGRDGRATAISRLVEVCPPARHCTFHLLGCWQSPLEVTIIDKLQQCNDQFPHIRGVDSAIPFVYARAGKKINSQDRPDSNPIDFEFTKVNGHLLRHNIRHWRKAADCTRRWF